MHKAPYYAPCQTFRITQKRLRVSDAGEIASAIVASGIAHSNCCHLGLQLTSLLLRALGSALHKLCILLTRRVMSVDSVHVQIRWAVALQWNTKACTLASFIRCAVWVPPYHQPHMPSISSHMPRVTKGIRPYALCHVITSHYVQLLLYNTYVFWMSL